MQETEEGHCCKFPFDHEGKKYHACTKDDSGVLGFREYLWCYYDNGEMEYDQCKGNKVREKSFGLCLISSTLKSDHAGDQWIVAFTSLNFEIWVGENT